MSNVGSLTCSNVGDARLASNSMRFVWTHLRARLILGELAVVNDDDGHDAVGAPSD